MKDMKKKCLKIKSCAEWQEVKCMEFILAFSNRLDACGSYRYCSYRYVVPTAD